MASEVKEKPVYEKMVLGLIDTLQRRAGIIDVKLAPKPAVDKPSILSWEQKYSCMMPDDIKHFYQSSNGLLLTWNVKLGDNKIPVGKVEINALDKLVRIGGAGDKTQNYPTPTDIDSDSEDEVNVDRPRFDHRSRIFELDPCEGFGKVCYVFKNTRPGNAPNNSESIAAQKAEVWFLDRSLRWHFLASSFMNYFRQVLVHLGLPQWQYAFTDIGLSPQAQQWFNMYNPVRLEIDSLSYDLTKSNSDTSFTNQLDVGRVFKGKPDKKKLQQTNAANQNKQKKPPITSANRTAPGRQAMSTLMQKPMR